MEELTEERKQGLNVALNEATLLGLEVSVEKKVAAATLAVLTLPEQGPPPEDPRVQLLLAPVGRVVASLRLGLWNDESAEVVPFEIEELLSVVQRFDGLPVYGWEFFDIHDKELAQWGDRLSLDFRSGPGGLSHSITLFQEGKDEDGHDLHLDVCVWFDVLTVNDPNGNIVPLDEFIARGMRWWDGLYAGDERTSGYGIFPLDD